MSCSARRRRRRVHPDGELHDHLPGVNHLARLRADGGDRASGVGGQDGVALLFARGPDLRPAEFDLGLGGQELLLGLVEIGAGSSRPSGVPAAARK